jgi:hypothetical protein
MTWIEQDGYQTIQGRECHITLERRPRYCDRGNWLAKLFPSGEFAREIDEADRWPRYYMDETRAKLEVEAWLIKRGQACEALPDAAGTVSRPEAEAARKWRITEAGDGKRYFVQMEATLGSGDWMTVAVAASVEWAEAWIARPGWLAGFLEPPKEF